MGGLRRPAAAWALLAAAGIGTRAWSQIQTQPAAQKLPAVLETCKPTVTLVGAAPPRSGEERFDTCFAVGGSDDYYALYVMAVPPKMRALEGLEGTEKKNVARQLKTFLFGKQKSGSVIATFSLRRDNGKPLPLTVLDLASFNTDERKGFVQRGGSAEVAGIYGYLFPQGQNVSIQMNIDYHYQKKASSKIVDLAKGATTISTAAGYTPLAQSVAAPVFDQLTRLEDAIVSASAKSIDLARVIGIGGGEGAYQAARITYSLGPATEMDGLVIIGILRKSSILVDRITPNGKPNMFDTGITSFGPEVRERVLGRIIAEKRLDALIKTGMAAAYPDLESADVPSFRAACAKLDETLKGSNIGILSNDQVIAKWAVLAGQPNIRSNGIRNEACAGEADFARFNLPLPPREPIPLSAADAALLSETQAVVERARARALMAQTAASDGRTAANRVLQPVRPAGYAPRQISNALLFMGTQPDAEQRLSGVLRFLPPTAEQGDIFSGVMILKGGVPVMEGVGVYSFNASKTCSSESPAFKTCEEPDSYMGDVEDGLFSGLGELRWRDGSSFVGAFANNHPNGLGLKTLPDNTRLYGNFSNGQPYGVIIRLAPDGQQTSGIWTDRGIAEDI